MQLRISIPPVTRVLLVLLIGLSSAYQIAWLTHSAAVGDYLALVPQWSVFCPWVFATATFTEQNIATLLIAAATIFGGGRYLERAWDSREFGKFVLITTVIPNTLSCFLYVLWFALTGDSDFAWVRIQGSVALQAAFLVAFKQLIPEHTVTILKGVIKIRVKHFPGIYLLANTVSGVLFGTDTALVLAWLGFFSSWTYLRFYKTQTDLSGLSTEGARLRGDASETFAFAYFWPDPVQPPIAAIADGIYNALVALHICTPFSIEDVESGNAQSSARGERSSPSSLNQGSSREGSGKREEAERRRALALKALEQKLHATTANKQPSQINPLPIPHTPGVASARGTPVENIQANTQ